MEGARVLIESQGLDMYHHARSKKQHPGRNHNKKKPARAPRKHIVEGVGKGEGGKMRFRQKNVGSAKAIKGLEDMARTGFHSQKFLLGMCSTSHHQPNEEEATMALKAGLKGQLSSQSALRWSQYLDLGCQPLTPIWSRLC